MANEFIEEYNILLNGEISAVKTLNKALESVHTEGVVKALQMCTESHTTRVDMLRLHVLELGGMPSDSAGIWGPSEALFAQAGPAEHDTVAALEQAEAERLVNYEAQTKLLVGEVRNVLEHELLPGQHESHLILSSLLKEITPRQNA